MKCRQFLAGLLVAGVMVAPVSQAMAERVKKGSPKANAAFTACGDNGGSIVETGPVTSCIDTNGHGIVCDGVDYTKHPDHKGTCDTFRRAPKTPWSITAEEMARVKVVKAAKPTLQTTMPTKPVKPVKREP